MDLTPNNPRLYRHTIAVLAASAVFLLLQIIARHSSEPDADTATRKPQKLTSTNRATAADPGSGLALGTTVVKNIYQEQTQRIKQTQEAATMPEPPMPRKPRPHMQPHKKTPRQATQNQQRSTGKTILGIAPIAFEDLSIEQEDLSIKD